MPRQRLGARLWLEPERQSKATGKIISYESWVILDGGRKHYTGCRKEDRAGAELKLKEYLSDKYEPDRANGKTPANIAVADVLVIYAQDKGKEQARPKDLQHRLGNLLKFWGEKTLAEVKGSTCREYVQFRSNGETKGLAAARRELEDLKSAINHHRKEGLCDAVVDVWLPPKAEPKEHYLTRSEAAKLLWAAWTMKQEQRGRVTKRRVGKHLARFILMGLYSGTRSDALLGASFVKGEGQGMDQRRHRAVLSAQGGQESDE
jgi:hypothetical protein